MRGGTMCSGALALPQSAPGPSVRLLCLGCSQPKWGQFGGCLEKVATHGGRLNVSWSRRVDVFETKEVEEFRHQRWSSKLLQIHVHHMIRTTRSPQIWHWETATGRILLAFLVSMYSKYYSGGKYTAMHWFLMSAKFVVCLLSLWVTFVLAFVHTNICLSSYTEIKAGTVSPQTDSPFSIDPEIRLLEGRKPPEISGSLGTLACLNGERFGGAVPLPSLLLSGL